MTLTTHAIIGAGIVSLAAHNPALGICAAFASHFIIDTIPHINYEVRSTSLHPHGESTHINFDKVFFRDVFYISLDGISGLIIPIILFANPKNFWLIVAGACAGMFPDALQFVYSRFKHEPSLPFKNSMSGFILFSHINSTKHGGQSRKYYL